MAIQKILIIEDDQSIRDNLRDLFELEGYSVATAGNGKEGFTLIREYRDKAIILLDLMMPVMTGEELLEALKETTDPVFHSLPIIVLSAKVNPPPLPVHAFFRKPIDVGLLLETVEVLAKRSS